MGRTSLTYDQMEATTREYFDEVITSQVYDENILLSKLREGKRVKVVTGGRKVVHPIRDAELAEAIFVNPNASRVAVHKQTRTALELDWKYAWVDAVMMWDEKIQNRGKPQVVSLIKDKLAEAMEDMEKKMSTVLYQAAASKATDEPDGLYKVIASTTSSTYAGISGGSSGDSPYWTPGLYDTSTTTLALYGSNSLDYAIRSCWFKYKPDLLVTTRAVASQYASLLQTSERREPMNGKTGATDLWFQGIPIIADPQCLSGDLFILNTKHLWLYVQEGENFARGTWEPDPTGMKRDRASISFVGNFLCDFRRGFGAFSALNYS